MPKNYRIGEVAALLNLKTSVLRFWETEFAQLAPLRTAKGQRLYSEATLETARRIRQLVHVDGMTIEGARRVLEAEKKSKNKNRTGLPGSPPEEETTDPGGTDRLESFRRELLALKALLTSQENS